MNWWVVHELTVFGGYLMQEFDDFHGDCIYKIEEQISVVHSKYKMINYHEQHIALHYSL